MLILALTIVAIVSPVFFNGHLSRFSHVRVRYWWLLFGALVAQVVVIEIVPAANRTLLVAIHLTTYVIAGVFVGINWRVPGLLIIAAGGACNGITIALNDGVLPASRTALKMAGIASNPDEFVNSGVLEHPTLAWLGDVFVWPAPMPLANVYSIGDILIVFGAFYGAHKIAGSRLMKTPWVPRGVDVPWTVGTETAQPVDRADGRDDGRDDARVDVESVLRGKHAVRSSRPHRLTPLTGKPGQAG